VFSSTSEEDFFEEKPLKYPWLSIHIRDPMMQGKSGIFRAWNLQETPWTQELRKNMKKNMKIPRKKEKPEQPVIVSRITRLPA
jgi:hypothetical protein